MMKVKPWSNEEIDILREHCGDDICVLMDLLPNRTRDAIFKRKSRMSLTGPAHSRSLWSNEEIKILKSKSSINKKCKLLPNRSKTAIKAKMRKLGIGNPRKYIRLSKEDKNIIINTLDKPVEEVIKLVPNVSRRSLYYTRANAKRYSWTAV